jgi:hypothetical protein
MRRYSSSLGCEDGDIDTPSHLHNVIAAVKPATPRQAASSKPRPFGRGRTVCAGTVTKDWKQPARRSL